MLDLCTLYALYIFNHLLYILNFLFLSCSLHSFFSESFCFPSMLLFYYSFRFILGIELQLMQNYSQFELNICIYICNWRNYVFFCIDLSKLKTKNRKPNWTGCVCKSYMIDRCVWFFYTKFWFYCSLNFTDENTFNFKNEFELNEQHSSIINFFWWVFKHVKSIELPSPIECLSCSNSVFVWYIWCVFFCCCCIVIDLNADVYIDFALIYCFV